MVGGTDCFTSGLAPRPTGEVLPGAGCCSQKPGSPSCPDLIRRLDKLETGQTDGPSHPRPHQVHLRKDKSEVEHPCHAKFWRTGRS